MQRGLGASCRRAGDVCSLCMMCCAMLLLLVLVGAARAPG